jgi:hypothetical protein
LETDVLNKSILNERINSDFLQPSGINIGFSSEVSKKAFKTFFDTIQGKKFVGHFAKKGQSINGYTFSKNGKYYLRGVDLKYHDGDFGKKKRESGGNTGGGNKGGLILNGRLKLSVKINTTSDYSSLIEKIITIIHETLLHVYEFTLDFIDNKKVDYSHDTFYQKTKNNVPSSRHHLKFHNKKDITSTHPFAKLGLNILESVNKDYNLGHSRTKLWKMIWQFED